MKRLTLEGPVEIVGRDGEAKTIFVGDSDLAHEMRQTFGIAPEHDLRVTVVEFDSVVGREALVELLAKAGAVVPTHRPKLLQEITEMIGRLRGQ